MKKIFNVFLVLVITVLMGAQPVFAAPPAGRGKPKPPVASTSTPMWGAYSGNSDTSMAAFESYVGKKMGVNAMFWGWDADFPVTSTGSQGKTLLIFWEPWLTHAEINSGAYDAYITKFALGAKAYGYPVTLVPMPEFNLNETPWGNAVAGNTPESFIAAWKHIRDIFSANAVANVKFGMAYNNVSIPAAPYTSFYPGSTYVDYVGVDGFNFGGQTFAQVFDHAITEATALGKPVWLFSTGSVAPKSQFVSDLGGRGLPWIWFNQSPFNIDSESLVAFKSII